jgi:signal peptidase I
MFTALLHRWRSINEWLRAFVLAVLLLAFVHLFLLRWVTVHSTSMYATLLPGDLVLVQRWPVWTGFERGDVVVFRDPLKDREPKVKRPLLVKRIAGMPGDTVELRAGVLWVNGVRQEPPATATWSHLLRMRGDHAPDSLMRLIGLPMSLVQQGRRFLEIPLNRALADSLEQLPEVVSAEAMSLASGAPRHIFPFSERFRWNGDNYGPIIVPAKGDTLRITTAELPLYDRLLSIYEDRTITMDRNTILIDGEPLGEHVVDQDYYFVLGDSRHHSADSRYWGFLPGDHLVGRARYVVLSKGETGIMGGLRPRSL